MKALTLTQPWATLVANGSKKIETRSWYTSYRGVVAIHAAKGFPGWAKDECYTTIFQRHLRQNEGGQFYVKDFIKTLPLGAVIAVAYLAHVMPTDAVGGLRWVLPALGTPEHAFGDYSPGRFAWFFENVRPTVTPIPCKGMLGLWEVPEGLL